MGLFETLKNLGVTLMLGSLVKFLFGFAGKALSVSIGIWVYVEYLMRYNN